MPGSLNLSLSHIQLHNLLVQMQPVCFYTLTCCTCVLCVYLNTIASDTDYTSETGEVTFAIGECTKDIDITIQVNPEMEDDEIFSVTLDTDCCANIITGEVTVTITEGGDCK